MKALIVFLIFGFSSGLLRAQEQSIQFSYDQAGNLIERKLQSFFLGRIAPFQRDTVKSDSLIFAIYPNPTNDLLNIDRIVKIDDKQKAGSTYKLVTINGQVVSSGVDLIEHATVNVSNLASGIYFLVIINEEKDKSIYKIIKSN